MSSEQGKEMNLWQRLVGIVTNPGETLEQVVEKPTVLGPVAVISMLNLVLFAIIIPKLKIFLMWTFENMPKEGMSAEQIAQMKGFMSTGGIITSGLTTVLMPLVLWLVIALLFKFFNLFVGNEAPFKKLYAVAAITSVPTILGSALRSILVATSPGENFAAITTSAALLLPKGSTGPLFAVLSSIDPFYIWTLVLLAIGAAKVLKTSVTKTGIFVFILWVLFAGVTAGMAALNPQQPMV